jgi:hypothetical protein
VTLPPGSEWTGPVVSKAARESGVVADAIVDVDQVEHRRRVGWAWAGSTSSACWTR